MIYLTITRPDIQLFVNLLSQAMNKPTLDNLKAVNRILKYIDTRQEWGCYIKGIIPCKFVDTTIQIGLLAQSQGDLPQALQFS